MPINLPVGKLKDLCNPFGVNTPWGVKVTQADVRRALASNGLVATPGGDNHAGRIAYLVRHKAHDAISIDVGCPSLGAPCLTWPVLDGNHRLAAAIYRQDETISAAVDGELGYAEDLFGVDCEEPDHSHLSLIHI